MKIMTRKVADGADIYHIVLPVRPALARSFDEDISPSNPEAIFCCSDLCCAHDPNAQPVAA